jgi:single-strand DNA-binding protein
MSKGRRVLVQGRLRQDRWEDKDTGKKQSRIEVTASDVTFLDGPGDNARQSESGGSSKSKKDEDVVIEDIDDKPIDLSEIPF